MTKVELQHEALKLPVEERLELAESLWESIERDAEALPLHDWQKELLDERLAQAKEDPDGWLSWEEVKQRVTASISARS
ncbi:MAG: addiction module protein [Acidobacteriota bacterium]|nr:addiction module protein [Acidobacteriota bacterium]